jgi:hypothetical protein
MLEFQEKSIKVEDAVAIYDSLTSHLSEMHEIYMGIGNVCYNGWQILKAQENYLKALELKQTERVYEYLAWVKGIAFDKN